MSAVERDVSGFATPPPKRRPSRSGQTKAGAAARPAPSDQAGPSAAPPAKRAGRRPDAASTSSARQPSTTSVATASEGSSQRASPVRVSVVVSAEAAERLRDATDALGLTQAEVVFEAQLEHGAAIEQDAQEQVRQRGGVPPRVRRRRSTGATTQLGLSMTPPEAAELKAAAARCHHTVAAHVAELLDRALT